MPATIPTPSAAASPPARADLLVLGVRSDRLADDLGRAAVTEAFAEAAGFTGASKRTLLVPAAEASGPDRLLVGLGPAAEVDAARLRAAAGTAGRTATRHAKIAVALGDDIGVDAEVAAEAVAEGWVLGAYRYDELRSDPKRSKVRSIVVAGAGGRTGKAAVARGVTTARAVNAARDLVNRPGSVLEPAGFADAIKAIAGESGLKVRVDGPAAIRRKALGGVLAVAQGATSEPRFVELSYRPTGTARGHVALVGKGVTFDTGGYSLKPSDSMKGMNGDMGGAAAVVGAMSLLAARKAPVAVTANLPLVENMIGPDAITVGDVITIRGGTTVEVLNTDAEGRLILADGLRLASEAGVDAIIDVATLTGACIAALGTRTAGLFGRDPALLERVQAAAESSGEAVWPLPMLDHLRPGLDSDIADLRNIGTGRLAGASVAAQFLAHFVDDDIPWAHLDIAGPSWVNDGAHGEVPKLGTGFGVRLLADLLETWEPLPAT